MIGVNLSAWSAITCEISCSLCVGSIWGLGLYRKGAGLSPCSCTVRLFLRDGVPVGLDLGGEAAAVPKDPEPGAPLAMAI